MKAALLKRLQRLEEVRTAKPPAVSARYLLSNDLRQGDCGLREVAGY